MMLRVQGLKSLSHSGDTSEAVLHSVPPWTLYSGSSDALGYPGAPHSKISAPHKTDGNIPSLVSAIRRQRQQITLDLRLHLRQ